eukprot:g8308.t1
MTWTRLQQMPKLWLSNTRRKPKDAWNSIQDQRASDEKKGNNERRQRSEKFRRINTEHQAALQKVEAEQKAADKAKELAAKRYADEIAAEHGKLQDARKQRKTLTELRRKAEEKAAAVAREATAAQTKTLQAKINLARERERKAAARARKEAKEKEALDAELAALSTAQEGAEKHGLGAAATPEVWELENNDGQRNRASLRKGVHVEVKGCDTRTKEEQKVKRRGKQLRQTKATVPGGTAKRNVHARTGSRRRQKWKGEAGRATEGLGPRAPAGGKKAYHLAAANGGRADNGATATAKTPTGATVGRRNPGESQHSGCSTKASFAMAGSKKGEFCFKHAKEGMKKVVSKKCSHRRCNMGPLFGNIGSRKAEFCFKHAKKGMINMKERLCRHPECTTQPIFGMAGTKKREFCLKHRKQGMVNVASKKCGHPGCIKQPHFGMATTRKREFCGEHAKEGMENLYPGKKSRKKSSCPNGT